MLQPSQPLGGFPARPRQLLKGEHPGQGALRNPPSTKDRSDPDAGGEMYQRSPARCAPPRVRPEAATPTRDPARSPRMPGGGGRGAAQTS
jgi:hypothetical protein